MYSIEYSMHARKYIKKLPKHLQTRILGKIERARIRPERFFERLVGKETYKLRVGNYRILADITNNDLHILVIEIGHRKAVYDSKKK